MAAACPVVQEPICNGDGDRTARKLNRGRGRGCGTLARAPGTWPLTGTPEDSRLSPAALLYPPAKRRVPPLRHSGLCVPRPLTAQFWAQRFPARRPPQPGWASRTACPGGSRGCSSSAHPGPAPSTCRLASVCPSVGSRRRHFPASPAAQRGHGTRVWPVKREQGDPRAPRPSQQPHTLHAVLRAHPGLTGDSGAGAGGRAGPLSHCPEDRGPERGGRTPPRGLL